MSIKVNGTDIGSSIKLNNTDLSEIIFNGVSVWKSLPASLEDATWAEIKAAIQNGTFSQFASVGDTKTFKINNKTYHAEVVAINDGTGSAGSWYPDKTVDFICKELYETKYRYNLSAQNQGGFPNSELKNTLNNTIYPLLPSDLKDVVIDKSHSYQSGSHNGSYWSSQLTTLATKLWLPTAYEISGTTQTYAPGESTSNNKKYTLASKIKKLNGESSASEWWLGSPWTTYSDNFWYVGTNGSLSGNRAYSVYGVPICFRIGTD